MVGPWRATTSVELGDFRVAGGIMLVAAAVRPLVGSPGVPCLLRSMTGIPCPFCGMTTSVTDTVWMRPVAAVSANPMGVVAVIAAVVLLVWRRRLSAVAVPTLLLPLTLLGMWLFELHRFRYL